MPDTATENVLSPEALVEFIDGLAPSGFTATPAQAAAARNVLAVLAARGELPRHGGEIAAWLGPVFCTTPAEQALFERFCRRWAPPPSESAAGGPRDARAAALEAARDRARKRWLHAGIALFFTVIAVIAAALYLHHRMRADPLPYRPQRPAVPALAGAEAQLLSPGGRAPVSGATVWYDGRRFVTDRNGRFPINAAPSSPSPILITHPSFDPVFALANWRSSPVFRFDHLRPGMTWSLLVPITRQRTVIPGGWRGFLVRYPWEFRLAVLLAGALPFLAWFLWGRLQRARLRRKASRFLPRELGIAVRHPSGSLFQETHLRRSIEQLRGKQKQETLQLDFDATVLATAENAGIITPVLRARLAPPEHLALIEQTTLDDCQTRWCETLLDRLESGGVSVGRYYFSQSPRYARPAGAFSGGNEAPRPLSELASSRNWARVILFSDGRCLFGANGEPLDWVESFLEWPERILLTPNAPECWGELEQVLTRMGFLMAPASPEGIALVTELLGGARPATPPGEAFAPYPAVLRREPERWLERAPPSEARLARLLAQLREYLTAEGFQWLAACAIFPAVSWPLAVWLGRSRGKPKQTEGLLLRLITLPWFRFGFMPKWLREALLIRLSPDADAQIRRDLDAFLSQRSRPGGGSDLRLAAGESREPAEDDLLSDHVFAQFLAGVRADRLSLAAPRGWRKFLFEHGLARFGLKPIAAAALLAVSVLGSVLAGEAVLARFGKPQVITDVIGYQEKKYDQPAEELDPVSMRALDVAASMVGGRLFQAGLSAQGFDYIKWCFAQAALILRLPDPVSGKSRIDQLTPIAASQLGTLKLSGRGLLLAPGRFVEAVSPQPPLVRYLVGEFAGGSGASYRASAEPPPTYYLAGSILSNPIQIRPIQINRADGLPYVFISPGTFTMGCSPGDNQCDDDEKPTHPVTITKGFWIGQTPVTQEAYRRVTGKSPSRFQGSNLPVEQVSWNDAVSYCGAVGLRLPTEAEWEYAARAGSPSARYGNLDDIAWYADNSGRQRFDSTALFRPNGSDYVNQLGKNGNSTHPVGQKLPNAWGLYDMLGNVWEWTADWYDKYDYSRRVAVDPTGPAAGSDRVLRAGSWSNYPVYVRASFRDGYGAADRNYAVGFRCAGELH